MSKKLEYLIEEDKLDHYLEYWMARLNLKHWDIEVRIARHKDLGDGKLGRNRYDWNCFESRIELIHPDDFEDWGPYDMEFILVHELLHLIIDVQYPVVKGRREIFSEQAINQIAQSFIDMERERQIAREEIAGLQKKKKRKKG